jgi:hypothetical protein
MNSREMIDYLKQTLQLTVEMQPLASEVAQYSIKQHENISELEKKLVISKVYLQEMINQLEDRYIFTIFVKNGLGIAGCILVGLFLGLLLGHK